MPKTIAAKPRLLVCIGEYVIGAGQTRVVHSELRSLAGEYDITLVSPAISAEVPAGVRAKVIPMHNLKGLISLARLMLESDIVHLHDTLAHMAVSVLLCRKRLVVTSHGIAPAAIRSGRYQRLKGQVTALLYPPFYGRAMHVVTYSEYLADWLRARGIVRLSVISLGAPDEVVPPRHRPSEVHLVCIGAVSYHIVSYRKGIDLLVQSIASCKKDFQLDIFGGGDLGWAQSLIERYRVSSRVTVHGRVDDSVIEERLDQAIALISMSRWEGFGLPVVEGFARGRPAIVLTGSAMAEVVRRSGAGIIVVDPSDVCGALATIVTEWDRFSQAVLAEAWRLRWTTTWGAYSKLFMSLVTSPTV